MEKNQRPIPVIQPWTKPFWKAAKEGKLLVQHCKDCGANIFFPKKVCPACWSENLGWIEASGKAKVYTFSVMTDMVEPRFMGDLPYILAMVDLEEGIRMTTRVVNCRPEEVHIDMPVSVIFEDLSPECALPMFEPADEAIRIAASGPKEKEASISEVPRGLGPKEYRTILWDIDDKRDMVCTITLNRPEKYNAINRRMAAELTDAFRRVREMATVGVVVLQGAGKAFCTGGDLEIFPSLAEHRKSLDWLAHEGLDVQRAISGCEKIVICKIHGHCLAGGLELALACDLLYATESARMGATEINMGILPGWGGTARLPRSMPVFRAREIILSGRKDYLAKEMYEMGFLTRVFKDEDFEAEFEKVLNTMVSKKPIALRMAKEIMARSVDGCDLETALALERNGIQWLTGAPDIQAMMDQFRTGSGRPAQSLTKQSPK